MQESSTLKYRCADRPERRSFSRLGGACFGGDILGSGKRNYFRHSFNARNDEFIVGLMNEFKEKGYFMWFALCEMSGEMLADGHKWPLKFNQSRLYKELRCNHSKLHLFFTYCEHRSKIGCTYSAPTFSLEIPSLLKYVGKYSENVPNKIKEKEIKEKEIKLPAKAETVVEKSLPEILIPEETKRASPISILFDCEPEIQAWLNAGTFETHLMLLKKFSHHVLVEQITSAYAWAKPRSIKAETWLYTFVSNKNTHGLGANKAKAMKSTATPDNPTGDPYLAELNEHRKRGESA